MAAGSTKIQIMPHPGPFTRKVIGRVESELIRTLQSVSLDRDLAPKAGRSMVNAAYGDPPALAEIVF